MKKAGFIILFVAILFGLSKPPIFADNEKAKEKEITSPVEIPVTITVPTIAPTVVPLPTITKTTPTPTHSAPTPTPIKTPPTPTPMKSESTPTPTPTQTPVTTTGNNTGGSSPEKKEEKPANATTSTSIQTAATAVTKNTVKKTISKTPQNKPVVTPTKVGNIIVPTLSSDVKVKGANYYIDEKLSKDTTMALISFSFFLFIMGVGILNVPNFIRSIADIRRKNAARKSEHPFTIRYLDL